MSIPEKRTKYSRELTTMQLSGKYENNDFDDDGFGGGIHAGLGFGRRNVFVGHGKRLVTVNNKSQEVDRLSTELGDAVAELDQAKLDLIALGDRIEALEDKNLSLSEYAEFSALANRVQTLEAKWGQEVRDSIENNTSAIESINLELEAFFADKADATAKDIYDKLVALETWKTDVVEQFMSGITNSEATG